MESKTYLTKADLRDRGWNTKSIRSLLAISDKSIKHASKSIPTQLYKLSRIVELENTEQFQTLNQEQPKKSSNKYINDQTKEILNWVNSFEIETSIIETETLYQEACYFWHLNKESYYLERKQYNVVVILPDYKSCDRRFLHRITLTYLKNLLYHPPLSTIQKKTSIGREKEVSLKTHFYTEISKAYPFLTKECKSEIIKLLPS